MTRPLRVLVADDERNLRELMVRELARKGHLVEGAGDGEAALARLREAPHDVGSEVLRVAGQDGLRAASALDDLVTGVQLVVWIQACLIIAL